MKKLLRLKTMLLLCALIAGSGSVWAEDKTIEFTASTVQSTDAITGNSWGTSYTTHRWVATTSDNSATIYFGGQVAKQSSMIAMKNTHYLGNIDPSYDASASFNANIPSGAVGAIPGNIKKIEVSCGGTTTRGIVISVHTSQIVGNTSATGIVTSSTLTGANVSQSYDTSKGYKYFYIKGGNSSYSGINSVKITYEEESPAAPVDLTSFAFAKSADAVQLTKNGTSFEASYTQKVAFEPAAYDGTVTYSIDYDDANTTLTDDEAIIDDETGEVTISLTSNKAGSVVVKASGAATSAYNAPADATYTLTVNAADLTLGAPVFTPAAGAYYYGQMITVSAQNAEFINYTANGSDPDDSSDSFPVAGYQLTGNVTLKAIAFDEDINSSAITTAVYTLKAPEAPTFSLTGGEVKAGTTVTLTAGEGGSVVVYTTDGTAPTADSDIYDGPIAVNTAMTIKAATVDDGDNLSAVATASFTIKQVDEFVKVTDASTLRAGDQLLIVNENANVALGAINTSGSNDYYVRVSITRDADATSFTVEDESVAFLTLGGEEDAWTLKSSLSNNYLSLPSNANALSESTTATSDNQKWTISISSGDATITNVKFSSNTRFIQYNKNSGSERFACYQGKQQNVQLYRLSKSVTITAAEYATYAGAKALNFNGVGIKVYTATDNKTSVTLNEITSGKVPANTPVVLYKEGADGTAISVPVIASAEAVGDNDLQVSTGTDVENMYVLAMNPTIGFYPWAGDSDLSAGKVYLQGKASYGARAFIGFDDNETTGIASTAMQPSTEPYYDLQGRRVAQPTKGLYIVNGKKVVIK